MTKASKKKKIAEPAGSLRFPETAEPMSGDQLRVGLDKLEIGQSAFGRLIGVGDRTVRSWLKDEFPVPMPVGYLVSLMIKTKTKPDDLKI